QQPTGERSEDQARNDPRMRGLERGRDQSWMDNALKQGLQGHAGNVDQGHQPGRLGAQSSRSTATSSDNPWSVSLWHHCTDGTIRRVPAKPWLLPLADDGQPDGGVMAESGAEVDRELYPLRESEADRVGLLRGAGNAINPWIAAEFIRAAGLVD